MNKPEKLILDYSKWRCGGNHDGDNVLGIGHTYLLNEYGFSCCLGLWSKQLGADDHELMDIGDPCESINRIPLFVDMTKNSFNSELANDCISINDNETTTPEQKIELLKERLQLEGIQLEVINKP